jgi:hypothetical protein
MATPPTANRQSQKNLSTKELKVPFLSKNPVTTTPAPLFEHLTPRGKAL